MNSSPQFADQMRLQQELQKFGNNDVEDEVDDDDDDGDSLDDGLVQQTFFIWLLPPPHHTAILVQGIKCCSCLHIILYVHHQPCASSSSLST